jgi:hypothetical protein
MKIIHVRIEDLSNKRTEIQNKKTHRRVRNEIITYSNVIRSGSVRVKLKQNIELIHILAKRGCRNYQTTLKTSRLNIRYKLS